MFGIAGFNGLHPKTKSNKWRHYPRDIDALNWISHSQ